MGTGSGGHAAATTDLATAISADGGHPTAGATDMADDGGYAAEAPPAAIAGGSLLVDDGPEVETPTKVAALKEEASSMRHLLTHVPFNRFCSLASGPE